MAQLRRNLEDIKKIIIHCSDSDNPWHDDISVIRDWHLEAGFDDVGYHLFVPKNPWITVQEGRKLEIVGAHCLGHNKDSVGFCLSGKNKFEEMQFYICALFCQTLAKTLGWPTLKDRIFPHNYFNKLKTCPNFPIENITDLIEYP